jgi:hypothetical protein
VARRPEILSMPKLSPLRLALVAAVVSLTLAAAGASGSSRDAGAVKPTYEIVNLMPTFFAFWDTIRPAANEDTARLVHLFREHVVQPHAEFYEAYALGYVSEIETALGTYAGFGVSVWSIFQTLTQIQELYGVN